MWWKLETETKAYFVALVFAQCTSRDTFTFFICFEVLKCSPLQYHIARDGWWRYKYATFNCLVFKFLFMLFFSVTSAIGHRTRSAYF